MESFYDAINYPSISLFQCGYLVVLPQYLSFKLSTIQATCILGRQLLLYVTRKSLFNFWGNIMERVDLPLAEYSFEQKLDLLETLWADLAQNDAVLKSPDWHGEILKDREQASASGSVKVSDWEAAKKRIRRNVSCE